jgi:hypothetical protein
VLRTVRRYTPEQVQADVSTSVRRLGTDLRAAVDEARSAMADREAELRSELRPGGGPPVAEPPAPAAAEAATPPAAPAARRGNRRRRSRHAHLS